MAKEKTTIAFDHEKYKCYLSSSSLRERMLWFTVHYVQENNIYAFEKTYIEPHKFFESDVDQKLSSTLHSRALSTTVLIITGSICVVQYAPVLYLSLWCEMWRLCSESKHSFMLRRQRKYLELG